MSLRDGEYSYHDLERSALAFVLEDEAWPVFLAWVGQYHISEAVHNWLAEGPDLAEARKMWAEHSPDEDVRALAAGMP